MAPLAAKLDKADHDVERVVDVSELGEGVDDTTIRRYAVEEDGLIITSGGDFVQMQMSRQSISGTSSEGFQLQLFRPFVGTLLALEGVDNITVDDILVLHLS